MRPPHVAARMPSSNSRHYAMMLASINRRLKPSLKRKKSSHRTQKSSNRNGIPLGAADRFWSILSRLGPNIQMANFGLDVLPAEAAVPTLAGQPAGLPWSAADNVEGSGLVAADTSLARPSLLKGTL